MSDTRPSPGTGRATQLPTGGSKAPRKLRLAGFAGLTGLIAVASAAALMTAPAANAATFTNNPTCAVPAGVSYQLVGDYLIGKAPGEPDLPPFVTIYEWQAFSNGLYYYGYTRRLEVPPNELVADGQSSAVVSCYTSTTNIF